LFVPITHFPVMYQVPCHPGEYSRAVDDMPLFAQTDMISRQTVQPSTWNGFCSRISGTVGDAFGCGKGARVAQETGNDLTVRRQGIAAMPESQGAASDKEICLWVRTTS
jgi:hypothetical protein